MPIKDSLEDVAEAHGEAFHTFSTLKVDTIVFWVVGRAIEVLMTSGWERECMTEDSIFEMVSGELLVEHIVKILD